MTNMSVIVITDSIVKGTTHLNLKYAPDFNLRDILLELFIINTLVMEELRTNLWELTNPLTPHMQR